MFFMFAVFSIMYLTFSEFYPFYLSEHVNRTSRRLHFIGTTTALILVVFAFITQMLGLVAIAFVQGYAFALIGHFFFEYNKPATLTYPWFIFLGDWCLWWEMLTGKIRF